MVNLLGKMLGIRIVDLNNRILPLGSLIFKRYFPVTFVALIPLVGQYLILIDSLFVLRKDKRCIHDFIAGTRVVKV